MTVTFRVWLAMCNQEDDEKSSSGAGVYNGGKTDLNTGSPRKLKI